MGSGPNEKEYMERWGLYIGDQTVVLLECTCMLLNVEEMQQPGVPYIELMAASRAGQYSETMKSRFFTPNTI